mmetsp:Transcript_69506/g.204008  ORF Transcript_69506/g.204008 Transcript_69506/m.204008 type:complete len:202 (-) Transcript_69506:69-674(-)
MAGLRRCRSGHPLQKGSGLWTVVVLLLHHLNRLGDGRDRLAVVLMESHVALPLVAPHVRGAGRALFVVYKVSLVALDLAAEAINLGVEEEHVGLQRLDLDVRRLHPILLASLGVAAELLVGSPLRGLGVLALLGLREHALQQLQDLLDGRHPGSDIARGGEDREERCHHDRQGSLHCARHAATRRGSAGQTARCATGRRGA